MNNFSLFVLLVFGVMEFGAMLFFRTVYLYCEWQEGNEIDWRRQFLITFGIPGAYMLVLLETMWATGLIVLP